MTSFRNEVACTYLCYVQTIQIHVNPTHVCIGIYWNSLAQGHQTLLLVPGSSSKRNSSAETLPKASDMCTVGLFVGTIPKHPTSPLRLFKAWKDGVTTAGDEAFLSYGLAYQKCDVAIIFGGVKRKRKEEERMQLKRDVINQHHHNVASTLIVVDWPYLGRVYPNPPYTDGYIRHTVNGLFTPDHRRYSTSLYLNTMRRCC